MPGVERMHLEEALEDSPQTRNLLGVFEKDGLMLKKYILHLNKCCGRIITAQREMTAATQALSAHLKVYDQQRFPLESEGSIFSETVKQFAQYLDELSTVHQILATQMGDGMMFPISKFIQADLDELSTVGEMYKMSTNDLDESLGRYMKLSKKKDNEKVRQEACDDVYQMRKKFHQTALHYYSSLNTLQYKRKSATLEPMIGMMAAQKAHFTMGTEATAKTELKDFLVNTTASVQGVKAEMAEETNKTVELIDAIEENSVHLYHTEPSPELPYIPPNPTLNQKGGYLFVRNKQNILNTKWERCYFFIQGGNLMSQARDQFAGSLVLDLNEEGVVAESLECDDRRHIFHVISPKHKKSIILQAENGVEKEEWIATLNNAARESGYTKDYTSNSSPLRAMTIPVTANRPANTLQPLSRSVPPPTPPSSPQERSMVFDAPIQFDIITPSEQDRAFQQMVKDGPPKRINPFDQDSHNIIGPNMSDDSDFSQNFVVRFLGSMEVKSDRGEQLILESMRQIMAARAIHNIFKTTESHLVVSSSTMRLLDPSNNSVRTMFLLEDISFWAAHNENKRLFGFIVRNKASVERDRVSFSCFVFECNTNADEICHAIATATKLAYQALMSEEEREKLKEQQKKETNLLLANISALEDTEEEEDVRLDSGEVSPSFDPDDLPLSPDGQYVLLTDTPDIEEAPPSEPDPIQKGAELVKEVEVESEA